LGRRLILGMDIEAARWEKEVRAVVFPAAVFITALVFLFLMVVVFLAFVKGKERSAFLSKYFDALIVFFLGVILTIFTAHRLDNNEKKASAAAFEKIAALKAQVIKNELLDIKQKKLEALAGLFERGDSVDSGVFNWFAEGVIKDTAINKWMWIKRTSGKDKGVFNGQIKTKGLKASGEENYLYPVLYEAPDKKSSGLIGFNMGSIPEYKKALEYAAQTGMAISAPHPEKKNLVLLLKPAKKQGQEELSGFAAAELDLQLMAGQFSKWDKGVNATRLHILRVEEGKIRMIAAEYGAADEAQLYKIFSGRNRNSTQFLMPVFCFGGVYLAFVHTIPGSIALDAVNTGLIMLLAGLALTLGAAFYTALLVNRENEMEKLVRKRSAELSVNENILRATLYSIADAVISLDNSYNIIRMNRAAEILTGWNEKEAVNMPVDEVLNVKDRETKRKIVFKRDGEIISGIQGVISSRNGTEREIEGKTAGIRIQDTGKMGTVIVFRDITENMEFENERKMNEERLASLVRIMKYEAKNDQDFLDFALNEAVNITGSKLGNIFFYDEETKKIMLNSCSKGVMAQCDVINPQRVYELDKIVLWGEAVRRRSHIIVNDYKAESPMKKGCSKGYAEIHRFMTIPVKIGGKIVAVAGVANKDSDYQDTDVVQLMLLMNAVWEITERRRTEQRLNESREKILSIFKAAPIGIALVKNRVLIEVNPFFSRMTGYDREELSGKNARMLYASENEYERAGREKYGMMEKKSIGSVETQWKRKDGRIIDVMISSTPLDPADLSKGVTATVVDLTDRKEAERQLRESFKKLMEIDELKSNFISMVSHELRTPLTAIKGFLKFLLQGVAGPLNQQQREYIEIVMNNSDRLLVLINDILDISKMESGSFSITKRKKDFADIAGKVVRGMSAIAAEKKLRVVNEFSGEIIINADDYRIEQVLQNLLSNAMKFSPVGSEVKIQAGILRLDEIKLPD
ncbi:MAG TPA: PAS domain S-box protein, partial [Firmicutes bacterium]|nr:PAS domain S-box protein [Bacillota bacterium]